MAKYHQAHANDPAYRLHGRIAAAMRRAMASLGADKDGGTFSILGYTPADLVKHIQRQFVDGMSWQNMGEWHIDHIVPISSAETRADVVRLNALSNLRPLWARDNLQKSAKRLWLV